MLPTVVRSHGEHSPIAESSIADSLSGSGGTLTFVDETGAPTRMSGSELLAHATTAAVRLRQLGVHPGDRVCLLAPTSVATLVALFGIWRLGAVPVVVSRAQRGGADSQLARLTRRVADSGAVAVVTEPDLRDSLGDTLGGQHTGRTAGEAGIPVVAARDLEQPGAAGAPPAMPEPDQLGLLQFTSGTTGASRAVPVTQGQIVGNMREVLPVAGLRPGNTYVTWLPLYHDMGIVSLTGMIANGVHVVCLATETFMRRPAVWMETIATYRANATAAPNFAYELAARTQQLRPRALDLSHLAVAFNGAEPVTADAVDLTLHAFRGCGLRPEAICPTYGLAEATLGVTTSAAGERVRFVTAEELPGSAGTDRPDRPIASCGRPIAGTSLAIRDAQGNALPEGAIGEVLIHGPGVMPGYWRPDGEPSSEPTTVEDGWLHTGDLGFLRDGELYVCGRTKDMIIVGGRNFYPEDYENVVEQTQGVRAGNAIAFSLTGSERMVVVAECRGTPDAVTSTGRELLERLRGQFEHAPEEVVLVRPGTLPKTSSGKRQRSRCRDLYLTGELAAVHSVR